MKEVYLVYKTTRRTEDTYETIEVFDNLESAIKWYNQEIETIKEPGGLLHDFNAWGYKENIDYEVIKDDKEHRFFVYDYEFYYEASVFILTKPLRK